LLQNVGGAVAFYAVSFHYAQTDGDAVNGLSLRVPPGTTKALVGPSGGGKKTIAVLLPRFYDVTRRRVTLDGTDVREVTLYSLYQQISYVVQKSVLFNDAAAKKHRLWQ
jgi:ABC-type multidrug transport system fused ATPase/permease subunit